MTVNKSGYNIPSSFQMINQIQHDEPKMLLVHKTEFERIIKINNKGKSLTKPYLKYLEMLYIKYILNTKKEKVVIHNNTQHIGIKMLNYLQ